MSPKILINDKEVEIVEEVNEDDIEELLKYKISWKTVLKIVIILILVGVVLYYVIIGVFPSDVFIYVLVLLCIIGGIILISLEHEDDVDRQTVSALECPNCDFQMINSYEKGDYIFKNMGKCSNCEGNLQIAEIYSVKLAKKQKEEEK